MEVEITRSDKTNATGEHHWFIVPTDSHIAVFSAPQDGDAGLKACMTWLENNGYTQRGESFPECNIYSALDKIQIVIREVEEEGVKKFQPVEERRAPHGQLLSETPFSACNTREAAERLAHGGESNFAKFRKTKEKAR